MLSESLRPTLSASDLPCFAMDGSAERGCGYVTWNFSEKNYMPGFHHNHERSGQCQSLEDYLLRCCKRVWSKPYLMVAMKSTIFKVEHGCLGRRKRAPASVPFSSLRCSVCLKWQAMPWGNRHPAAFSHSQSLGKERNRSQRRKVKHRNSEILCILSLSTSLRLI